MYENNSWFNGFRRAWIFGRSRTALDCCEGALDAFMGMMDDGIRKVFEY